MRFALLILPLVAAACGGPGLSRDGGLSASPVRPVAVTLYRDTVTARMSDGSLCTGVRESGAGPWATGLRGCPHGWPVEVMRPTSRPRMPLEPVPADPWVRLGAPQGPLDYGPRR